MEELTTQLIIPDNFTPSLSGLWFTDKLTGEVHSKKELIEILKTETPCNQN